MGDISFDLYLVWAVGDAGMVSYGGSTLGGGWVLF